jgi:hypothetical protein
VAWRAREANINDRWATNTFRPKRLQADAIALNLTRHEQDACDPKKIENFSLKICVGFDRS